jgi:drug/metabolite transporter (DMT)-like permease
MAKLLAILVFGLVLEAVGVVFLSRGLKQIGEVRELSAGAIAGLIKRGATNGHILFGVALEAGFFACLLVLMSKGDVSFVWPLTAMGFVLTTLAARFILHEHVSPLRWSGVVLIMIGAAIISWTEHQKPAAATPPVTAESR